MPPGGNRRMRGACSPADAGFLPVMRRMPPIRRMHSIYRIAALRTSPTPYRLSLSPSRPPPPRQASSDVFPPQLVRHHFFQHKKIATRFRMTIFHPLFFLNSHPKHDPHTHPNHYFFFSILFRSSSRYFSKNPGIFTPSR